MLATEKTRQQLEATMERYKMEISSCHGKFVNVQKSFIAGYFENVAEKDPQEGYRTKIDNNVVFIFPGSSLFHTTPPCVLYQEVRQTTKEYMHNNMLIHKKWLVEMAPEFWAGANPRAFQGKKSRIQLEPLHDPRMEKDFWKISKRKY